MPERAQSPRQMPLLEPKFHAPRLPAQTTLVQRERLFEQLQAGLERRLTLLCAPAGSGKTTLAGQWLDVRRERLQLPALAWISLESSDNDPVRFWHYVITACQVFQPTPGQAALEQILAALKPPFPPPSLESVLTSLLNDLTRLACHGMLVLEDYQVITETAIHQTVTFLLEHLPATFHVMILTRSEPPLPLVRWRARDELCEIYAADLRFSQAETESFLRQNTPLPPDMLTEETLKRLDARLEGWAVGLRLLSLALQGNHKAQNSERALAAFAGEQRSLQEYFVTEVLNAQPEPLQDFLLRTSVLHHLTGDLCDALLQRHDSEHVLESVTRAGLFLEPLEGTQRWYRYHALFSEAMRAEARRRFGEDALRSLFRRVSQWYEQKQMFSEAVEAAFQAQDPEQVATLLERFLHSMDHSILNPQSFQSFHTLNRWFEQLPEERLLASPALCMGYASSLLLTLVVGQELHLPYTTLLTTIERLLERAEQGFRQTNDTYGIGAVLAFRALITREQGAVRTAVTYAEQALTYLPAGEQTWRGVILNVIGMGKLLDGELAEAQQIFLHICSFYESFENRAIKRANNALLNIVTFERGELRQANAFFQHMLAEAREEGDRDDIAHAQLVLAWLAYEWDDLTTAEQRAQETLHLSLPLANQEFQTQATLILARIEYARGEHEAALQRCSALLAQLPATNPLRRRLVREVLATRARFQLGMGDAQAAQRWMEEREQANEEFYLAHHLREELTAVRCLLALRRTDEALKILSTLLDTAQGQGFRRFILETQTLLVLAYASSEQPHQAQKLLQTVLAEAHSEGYQRLFLDEGETLLTQLRTLLPHLREGRLIVYVQRILRASSSSKSGALPINTSLTEPLSAQEQRVLRLLAAGRSNPEIAGELVVSVNTIKVHVQNIYRKLNVNNRVEASEVARLLQLL